MSLDKLKSELEQLLKPFVGQQQNGLMEKEAQATVDRLFKGKERRNQPVMVERASLQITGVELAFDIGRIGLKRIRTKFVPDVNGVHATVPDAVALGFVNSFQLYITQGDQPHPTIHARYGMAKAFTQWCPATQGPPPVSSVFHVAMARAAELGYDKSYFGGQQ